MIEYWHNLQAREKKLAIAMAIVVAIMLFQVLVWKPLAGGIESTSAKLERQKDLLAWVQTNTERYKAIASSGKGRSTGSLSGIVNSTARQYKISIDRVQPQGDNIQVWIDEVPFTNLLDWLETLNNKRGLKVLAIDITNADEAGVVTIRRLQLGRS
ncbi:type II secretion system protein GspM [Thalassotalea agarivorans]|uniref:General secretion pathway protein M n=1 Tax=Thalassotalea agarivorans TaxID=349064 RepID=A0A1I0E4Z1_THASX|nr:type II secretion system protein M [Thalassotalea agarivorans]SET39951.1 general secretion pathway protein M [Thalassotalea agarivorans]